MIIAWNPKLLVFCVVFVTTSIIRSERISHQPINNSILTPPTRDELISHMAEVTSNIIINRTSDNGLNICVPGVDRAALCTAIAQMMEMGHKSNENTPCLNGFAYDAVYICKAENGLFFEMWSMGLENIIAVSVEREIVAKFSIPVLKIQLLDTNFINYTRFINWLELSVRSLDEILSRLEEAKLTPLYETAAQLHVRKIKPPERITESIKLNSDGFDVCDPHVNRSLLCQAINVRYYGETSWNYNKSRCDEDKYPHFKCLMRTGEILLMRKGNFPLSIFLMDFEKEVVHFVVFITLVKDSLTNKYLPKENETPDPEPDEPASENFYPHQKTLPVHNHPSRDELDTSS